MYYSYIEIEYIATSFSPARMDLALKLLMVSPNFMAFLVLPNPTPYSELELLSS